MPPTIHRCADGAEFMSRAGPFLEASELENVLMLGLAQGEREPAYLAVVEDRGRPLACAMRTPPWKAIVSRGPEIALRLLAEDLHREYGDLPAVIGAEPDVGRFADFWGERTGRTPRRGTRQRILATSSVRTPAGRSPGGLRAATEDDIELLARWTAAFVEEVGLDDPSDHASETRRRVRAGMLCVWDDGEPTSMAGWGGRTRRGARINLVYTPPALRRRGYASACVAALTEQLLDRGADYCALFTDLANPTSNHIYETIGYRRVCEMSDYVFE